VSIERIYFASDRFGERRMALFSTDFKGAIAYRRSGWQLTQYYRGLYSLTFVDLDGRHGNGGYDFARADALSGLFSDGSFQTQKPV